MEESRYKWKQMSEDYNASYYNDKDYSDGKTFTIIDTKTGKEYIYPRIAREVDSNGKVYNQRIISDDLWNEEFIAWAICTSEDFVNYVGKEWFTSNVLNYVVEHYEFPSIFVEYPISDFMTRDLWNKAFQRNKEVVRYVPKRYLTSEMINSLGEIKNPPIQNIQFKDLTPELFEKIYFNCDDNYKLYIFKPAPDNYRIDPSCSIKGQVENLMSQKIADDILSIDIRTIWNIPKKYITKENAIKAMDTNILLMPYVPAEYQTPDYQKKAIDEKPENLSLIDSSVVTDEMIYYALSKKGSVLGSVPKEKRTLEVCDYAISNYGGALRNVPDNVKNSELCLKAVVKDPNAIKYVPVELLTQEFVDSLTAAGVVIPMKNRSYVYECLKVHKILEENELNSDKVVADIPKLDVNKDYSNIRLESLSGLFTDASLKLLASHDISTIGDLLSMSDNSTFQGMVLGNSEPAYLEITGAIKLLKCKYMNIDPMIYFMDTGDAYKDMRDFSEMIGFSGRAKNALYRNGMSPKKLYDIVKSPNGEYSLYQIRNAGNTTVQEILFKTAIVIDYYDKKTEKSKLATDDETIEALNEELSQVRAEIQRLNARTDEILAKIHERMLEKIKGGVSK